MKPGQLFKSRFPSTEDSGTAVFLTAFSKLEHHSRARSLTAVVLNSAPWVICRSSQLCSATMLRVRFHVRMLRCSAPLLRFQTVWSPPLLTACICDLCRVRVLVRLSHPRPPDRHQRVYRGCPAGTHPCAPDAQAVRHLSQSANSCCAELCCVAVSGGASSTSSCGLSRPYVLLCVLSQRFFFFF